ncbi:hypothetical protein CEXT_626261 [Caerostris extrusa]|uniref:Uncharacterized protein n=1 Tax=Caerostris extrusa TaxID=172846 RepID=A0AAV4U7Q1_CAEEX|nr:hypothetical protein CEXT_626261 [Caerostris extrusa]
MNMFFSPPGAAEKQAAGGVDEEAGHRDAQDGRAALPDDSQAGGGQAEERRGGRGNMPGLRFLSLIFAIYRYHSLVNMNGLITNRVIFLESAIHLSHVCR